MSGEKIDRREFLKKAAAGIAVAAEAFRDPVNPEVVQMNKERIAEELDRINSELSQLDRLDTNQATSRDQILKTTKDLRKAKDTVGVRYTERNKVEDKRPDVIEREIATSSIVTDGEKLIIRGNGYRPEGIGAYTNFTVGFEGKSLRVLYDTDRAPENDSAATSPSMQAFVKDYQVLETTLDASIREITRQRASGEIANEEANLLIEKLATIKSKAKKLK